MTYWAMTERPEKAVARTSDTLQIGPSALRWDGQRLIIDIDEITAPLPRRIRGQISVEPLQAFGDPITLDQGGGHVWWPIAPVSRVSVDLSHPDMKWQGYGYLDSNRGDEPLEDGVKTWTWTRLTINDAASSKAPPKVAVLYDLVGRRENSALNFGRCFSANGKATEFEPPPIQPLSTSLWQMKRSVASDPMAAPAKVIKTAEDSPFYTRSIIQSGLDGKTHIGMHESLNMDRFGSWWMKALMPVRMPRQFY